jgi:mannitol/fructose-specific phosphotransferase system IIA component (Ntr-type)
MNLLDILNPACIKAPLAATDKRGCIDELVDLLATPAPGHTPRVLDGPALREAVWARETTRTTGIGHGLAIPHGKCAGVAELAMAIGKPGVPIDFQAIDGKPVQLIILLASPPDRTAEHIQALARVSRLMTMQDFREAIYSAKSGPEIYELLRQHEGR